jgi:hypothetical protein
VNPAEEIASLREQLAYERGRADALTKLLAETLALPPSGRVTRSDTGVGRAEKKGKVYFARQDGLIKIGFSQNPWARMKEIGNPELLATFDGCYADEKDLHGRFSKSRVRGEWFEPSPDLLALIDELRSNDVGLRRSSDVATIRSDDVAVRRTTEELRSNDVATPSSPLVPPASLPTPISPPPFNPPSTRGGPPEKPADPLIDLLKADWLAARGEPLDVAWEDENALRPVLAKHKPEEIREHWRNGLTYTRFPEATSLRNLADVRCWNAWARPQKAATSAPAERPPDAPGLRPGPNGYPNQAPRSL